MKGDILHQDYNCLLQPLRLGTITLKNRIFISAHTYGFFDDRGIPTDKMFYYIIERARGGASLLIMGETLVNSKPNQQLERWGACISCDELVQFYRRVSDAMKPYGMKVFEQIFHPGGQVWPEPAAVAYAPSPIAHVISSVVPAEMSVMMIEEYIEDFGLAAGRVKTGGLDGVEVKLDQGKLHHQFLSPYFNRRTDQYGGSFERRMRFTLQTLECIRRYVGQEFIVGVRITGDTFPDVHQPLKDLTLDDTKRICDVLAHSGLINYISVNGATNSDPHGYWQSHGDDTVPRANFASLARAIKETTNLPTFVASQVLHPDDALQIISHGDADLVAMTRAHIADPEIITKVQNGQVKDIRPCIACNQSCVGNTWIGKEVRCIHNPVAGRERELRITERDKVSDPKHIVIVGGGPAGMETARVAGIRGHRVTLLEKTNMLGGQVSVACKAAHRQRLSEVTTYLASQLNKVANVQVKLGYNACMENIMELHPDAVVVAIGSAPLLPTIPGSQLFNCLTVDQVLEGITFLPGDHVMIVDEDWRLHALSVADLLSDLNMQITLITSKEFAGKGLNIVDLTSYHTRLTKKKVAIMTWTEVFSLTDGTVTTRNILTKQRETHETIKGIVFVNNRQPNRHLRHDLQHGSVPFTYIGDCVFPRGIDIAIFEGYQLGLKI